MLAVVLLHVHVLLIGMLITISTAEVHIFLGQGSERITLSALEGRRQNYDMRF